MLRLRSRAEEKCMLVPRRQIGFRPLVVAFVLALLVHLELLLTGILPNMYEFWTTLFPRPALEEATEVTLVSMTRSEWEQHRTVQPQVKLEERKLEKDERPKPEEREKEREEDLKGQVVDVAPTPDKRRPEDARFLSEHDTRVEKQTVSRHQRKDYGVAQPRPTVADVQRRRPSEQQQQDGDAETTLLMKKEGRRQEKSDQRTLAFELPDMQRRQSLKLKLDLDLGQLPSYSASDEIRGNSERLRLIPGRIGAEEDGHTGEEGEDQKNIALLGRPSLENLDMVTGAPSNDFIRDVPKGEETLLNSKEFRYATFFNRVKRGVSDHWNPGSVYLRHDPYGNIYGVKDRYTVLSVVLDSEGQLNDVNVAHSSGMGFLDDEAINAFRLASPFPNPPQGLLGNDGMIRFQFGFYFEIGDRPRIRAFQHQRYP